MISTKRCKQCGRLLSIDAYRKYASRGRGIYETTTGYHTVCRECENFNQQVNKAYNTLVDNRTAKQVKLLDSAKSLYELLASRGCEPKGHYAAVVLSSRSERQATSRERMDSAESYLATLLAPPDETDDCAVHVERLFGDDGEVVEECITPVTAQHGYDLLKMELTEEPDVYQEMVDNWRDSIAGTDGRVMEAYKSLFEQVASRIDKYEDNYQWD